MTAGYSRTPLPKKLGIKDDSVVALINAPDGFDHTLGPLPDGVTIRRQLRGSIDVVVFFTTERKAFEKRLSTMAKTIYPDGGCWIAWPKKASKLETDMTEDVVREVALPTGLVDNKVCAIDEVWSGLRVVHRRENR